VTYTERTIETPDGEPNITLREYGHSFVVPRWLVEMSENMLKPRGWDNLTDDEKAERIAESKRKQEAAAASLRRFRRQVGEVDDERARAILDLHKEHNRYCEGCDFGGYEAEAPDWPCRTVVLTASLVGIEAP
jgi:hypothetical protein